MARYIDANLIVKKLQNTIINSQTAFINNVLIGLLKDAPSADVVPKSEIELLRKQLEPFKEKQCFTCKHYDIGHDHVPCCYCKDYDKYIWLSADADIDIDASKEDRCVVCGDIIPEGRQICPKCKKSKEDPNVNT